MNQEQKRNLFNILLIILVVVLLIAFFLIFKYANSEGFKCLSDPLTYAYNHSQLLTKDGNILVNVST